MRGISMSSRMTSGTCSCSSAIASTPSFAVSTRMPLRSSRRCVTRRIVIESSTTSAKMRSSRVARSAASAGRAAPLRAHQRAHVEDDDDAAVAEDRRARDAADARDLRPDRLDDDLAAADQLVRRRARSSARRRAPGSPTRRRPSRAAPTAPRRRSSPRCWKRIDVAAVVERRLVLGEMALDLLARQARDALDGRAAAARRARRGRARSAPA